MSSPTRPAEIIEFDVELFLDIDSIDKRCASTIAATISDTLELPDVQVNVLEPKYNVRRGSLVSILETIVSYILIRITSSTHDFTDTLYYNTTQLYSKLSFQLTSSIENGTFVNELRHNAPPFGAFALSEVSAVNYTISEFIVLVTDDGGIPSDTQATNIGLLVGVVIGGVFFIVLCRFLAHTIWAAHAIKNKKRVHIENDFEGVSFKHRSGGPEFGGR